MQETESVYKKRESIYVYIYIVVIKITVSKKRLYSARSQIEVQNKTRQ